MLTRRRDRCLLLAILACGCPQKECADDDGHDSGGYYLNTSGRWRLTANSLQFDPCEAPGGPGTRDHEALLAGTRWCPGFSCTEDADCPEGFGKGEVEDCYVTSVAGPSLADGLCLELAGSGPVEWRFDPIPCEHPGIFLPEQISVYSAAVPEVHGRLVSYLDGMARTYLSPESGEFPAELEPDRDATVLKVAADQPLHMLVDLRLGDRRVAWLEEGATITVKTLRGAAPEVALDESSTVFVRAPAGSEAALELVVGATVVPLGRVVGVPSTAFADLEVVVGYGEDPDTRARIPVAARAVVRDGEGDLVYGAKAEWEVLAGAFPLGPIYFYAENVNHDYVALVQEVEGDDKAAPWCFVIPDSGARSYTARLAARVADLEAEVDMAWTSEVPPPGGIGDLFDSVLRRHGPNPLCQGPGFDGEGCACRSGRGGEGWALLGLALFAATRRRR